MKAILIDSNGWASDVEINLETVVGCRLKACCPTTVRTEVREKLQEDEDLVAFCDQHGNRYVCLTDWDGEWKDMTLSAADICEYVVL